MPKFMFLDTETTGVKPGVNGIIQLSGEVWDTIKQTNDAFDFKMRPFPDDVIEDEALAVNKRTREEIEQWRDPHDTYIAFKKFMGAYVDKFDKRDKFHFVAYNARFDSDHMREWFLKCGDVYFGSWFWYPPICVMDVAAFLLRPRRGELPNFKLQTVADFMGVKVDQAQCHEASYDVALCKALYFKLCDMTMKGK